MKKILVASHDAIVLKTLLPLIESDRIYNYRLVESISKLNTLLKDEKDFFIALVDAQLDKEEPGESIRIVLAHEIPVIALIGHFETPVQELLTRLPIIDYVSKENPDQIKRVMALCEDLVINQNKKAIVLHSNKTVEMYLVEYLKMLFFEPVVVRSMDEALRILRTNTPYSMLLINNEYSKMKGYEFIKLIREDPLILAHPLNKDLIIFGITSSELKDVKSSFLKNGADDIFKIPFAKEEFNTKVSKIMRHKTQSKILSSKLSLIDQYVISTKTDIYGVITDVSHAFEKISGFLKDELIGKPHSTVSHPDRDSSIFKELWKTIKSGHVWQGEIKNRSKDGEVFWLKINISPDFIEEILVGYTAISQDITAQKELETLSQDLEIRVKQALEENQKQTSQLIQQSRLAQMGEMISMIAHQWRQPLTSISAICGSMTVDVLLEQYEAEKFSRHLKNITEISVHLSSTINDFRSFFKEQKEKSSVTWPDLIQECLTIIGPSLDSSDITIVENYDSLKEITTFPNEVKQVIINIFKNAKDVLDERSITDPIVTLRSFETENRSVLCIEDNGGGIAEDILEKIFDPYFTTKDDFNGSGIGLYMSKTIMEEHCGGSLRVENSKEGASFELSLPLSNESD